MGQINRGNLDWALAEFFTNFEVDFSDSYVNTGGVYLLTEPVPYNGRITILKAYGFADFQLNITTDLAPFLPELYEVPLSNNNDNISIGPSFLFTLIYRPVQDGSVYRLVRNLTQLNHGFSPGFLPVDPSQTLNWEVQKGDLIGVYIPRHCVNRSDGILVCPSQVNLVADSTSSCSSAMYHSAWGGVDNLVSSEFKEVSLQLNIEAVIFLTSSPTSSNGV